MKSHPVLFFFWCLRRKSSLDLQINQWRWRWCFVGNSVRVRYLFISDRLASMYIHDEIQRGDGFVGLFFCLFFLEDERGTIEWEQLWLANFVTPRTKPKTKKASELFRMFWRRLRSSYSSDSDSKWSSSAPSPPPPTPPPCCCRHETSRICCASRCCFLHLMRRFWNHTFTWNDHQMRNHRTTD